MPNPSIANWNYSKVEFGQENAPLLGEALPLATGRSLDQLAQVPPEPGPKAEADFFPLAVSQK